MLYRARSLRAVRLVQLPHAADLPLPLYATAGASGADVHAAVDQPVTLKPAERHLIPTGLVIALPRGFEAQVRPRSGLALEHGVTVLNAPGTIDSDYRGEVGVLLVNLGASAVTIRRGDRIAQLVISRVSRLRWLRVTTLPGTRRGSGGFGHSGSRPL